MGVMSSRNLRKYEENNHQSNRATLISIGYLLKNSLWPERTERDDDDIEVDSQWAGLGNQASVLP
jgi:hypothetical protein